MKQLFFAFAFTGALAVTGEFAQAQTQNTLFGVTAFDNQLISLSTSDGTGTLIGDLGVSAFAYGVANDNGNLYIFDQNTAQIRQVNPATGLASSGIDIGVGAISGEGDLAFSSNGTGFLASVFDSDLNLVNNLYSFNISNGTSTLIGSTGTSLDGLAFSGNTLYALGQDDATLYTVNQSTAALTEIGSLGLSKNSPFGAITFAPDGTLYSAIDDSLYTINTTTGAATAVGPDGTGFNSISGLAFAPTPVPEPQIAALFAFGLLLLLKAGRKTT